MYHSSTHAEPVSLETCILCPFTRSAYLHSLPSLCTRIASITRRTLKTNSCEFSQVKNYTTFYTYSMYSYHIVHLRSRKHVKYRTIINHSFVACFHPFGAQKNVWPLKKHISMGVKHSSKE